MSKNKSKNSKSTEEVGNKADIKVFMTVFWYCILIIGSPVISFFSSKVVFDRLQFTNLNANIYAAIVAVIALHISLGIYLFRAYSDDEKKASEGKQD